MLPKNSLAWGRGKSRTEELAAYGDARRAEIGEDKVFDFSTGSYRVPAPACVEQTLAELLKLDSVQLHGYTPAPGLPSFRRAIAEDLNARYDARVSPETVYVCCGAAAGLAACMHGLLLPGEEVIAFAPRSPEYRAYVEKAGGLLVTAPPRPDLQPDLEVLERMLTEKTKLVAVNTPNKLSGVLLSAETLARLGEILRAAEAKFGHTIYLVSDEPYRELMGNGQSVPCPLRYYDDTVICYSFSETLSMPGARIGCLVVGSAMAEGEAVFAALAGAARACGYVSAPSLMQLVIERCLDQTADVSVCRESRELLYEGLKARGFACVYPEGAFSLFVKSPEPDAEAFSQRARQHELLLVPCDEFGLPGYVRLSFLVSPDRIKRSMPAFEALAREYGLL